MTKCKHEYWQMVFAPPDDADHECFCDITGEPCRGHIDKDGKCEVEKEEKKQVMNKIIAVDFDGCIVKNEYPEIGAVNLNVVNRLKREKANGARIILWTCRTGNNLINAIRFCAEFGLRFDTVNANFPDMIQKFGGDTRKIYADEYWDDKAVLVRA